MIFKSFFYTKKAYIKTLQNLIHKLGWVTVLIVKSKIRILPATMISTANKEYLVIATYTSFVTPVQHHHLPNKQNNKFHHR